ncbi:hypothetical protein V1L54_18775 [Streptomyces sp. TRM 70361]|uniref:hypothetical protein n=1 Tax=Streptomyces sp. TRM 70361 TaxID=3116553 RepID=UPI002E7AE5C6|nr:hypothetical protein [Streptomyces sp. TRM 70361]MEE1941425.1 hypothetical protein [Streptomyces sp. TRM 70361]
MGWTHDYRDVSRDIREQNSARGFSPRPPREHRELRDPRDPQLGIPHILRRRARWVGARLRHTRG